MRKLPKQWKDWIRRAGLRIPGPSYQRRNPYSWHYLHGKGRVWRVNNLWELECGDTYEEFDRWALCEIRSCPLPSSKDAFIQAVKDLLKAHDQPLSP